MDDLYSILGWPFMEPFRRIYLDEDFDEQDLIVSENIMNYYSNFVRTGYGLIQNYMNSCMYAWWKSESMIRNIRWSIGIDENETMKAQRTGWSGRKKISYENDKLVSHIALLFLFVSYNLSRMTLIPLSFSRLNVAIFPLPGTNRGIQYV